MVSHISEIIFDQKTIINLSQIKILQIDVNTNFTKNYHKNETQDSSTAKLTYSYFTIYGNCSIK